MKAQAAAGLQWLALVKVVGACNSLSKLIPDEIPGRWACARHHSPGDSCWTSSRLPRKLRLHIHLSGTIIRSSHSSDRSLVLGAHTLAETIKPRLSVSPLVGTVRCGIAHATIAETVSCRRWSTGCFHTMCRILFAVGFGALWTPSFSGQLPPGFWPFAGREIGSFEQSFLLVDQSVLEKGVQEPHSR